MDKQPITQVLLSISKPIQDEITTPSGIKFYYDGSFNKHYAATVTATIAALPTNPHPKLNKIVENLKVGDDVAVSYRIVADFSFQGDEGRFMQCTEDNPYYKEFVNGKGEWIRMYALPNSKSIAGVTWVGMYVTYKGDLISGQQGTEAEIGRWMSQFPFGKTDIYTFNNFFEYGKNNYWRCDVDDIFAKRVKGHLVAVGDRVICKPIEHRVPQEALIAQHMGQDVKIRFTDRARVISGGKEFGIKKDDTIFFDPKILERYTFWNKEYYLVNNKFIHGLWN